MLKKITSWWPMLIIFLVEVVLFFANYEPGTYLLGWDNVMPEFNLSANLERNLHGVWADYRGLGVLDGLAHTANVIHTLFIGLLSFVLPQSLLRWVFVFFIHILGGIGMYRLLQSNLLVKKNTFSREISLFGALFYQYNLATLQMFFTPLEVFIVHFAALPWLTMALIRFFESPIKRKFLLFGLLTLLFTPQSFVPSVWIAYMMLVGIISLTYLKAHGRKLLRPLISLFVLIGCVNAFWLFPYIYSGIHNAPIIAQTKINIMSNEDIALKQKEFADFTSNALLHGFSLNQTDYFQESGRFEYMMEPWRSHIAKSSTAVISWLLFILSMVGFMRSFLQKNWELVPFSIIYIIVFSLLATDVPVLSVIPYLLNTFVPYFDVVFRFAFTKFALLYAFVYGVLLVHGLSYILEKISIHGLRKVAIAFAIILIWIYSLPSFSGHFIYQNMKVSLPSEYHELFSYFKTRPHDERIALLPAHQYWSWQFYDFGARGSGFLWYGLKQPTMDRAFDPWSRENENFYWEISQALYSENSQQFSDVLNKYHISWILLDNHIISPDNPRILYTDRIRDLIALNPSFVHYKTFGNLELYAVTLPYKMDNHTFVSQATPSAPQYRWGNNDQLFSQYGLYTESESPSVIVPFQGLFSGRAVKEGSFNITEDEHSFFITAVGSEDVIDETMNLSSTHSVEEFVTDISVYTDDTELIPRIVAHEPVSVQIPKISGAISQTITVSALPGITNAVSCDAFRKGVIDRYITPEGAVRFSSINSSNCYTIDMPQLPHRLGYIITIESRYVTGKPMRVGVVNATSGKTDIDLYLPKDSEFTTSHIIIPPMVQYGVGYKLYIDTISIGAVRSVNDIKTVEVYPIPYDVIKSISFAKNSFNLTPVLVYSQSYSPHWQAYQTSSPLERLFPVIFADKLEGHTRVNNWANGWILPTDINSTENTIKIVYLPQYLEYIGFALLGLGILFVLLYPGQKRTLR
ncbi:hypothetical protein HY469_01740 [Candidatus Roizmanbacteria bacterium]|nr:hypothetical protein [Candidatus Roizmanbacteria bacterium]